MTHDIRKFINLVESIAYKANGYNIVSSPSKSEMNRLAQTATTNEGLRAIIDLTSGKLYVWDGYHATHDDASKLLGVEDYLPLHLWSGYVEFTFDSWDDDEEAKADMEKKANLVKDNADIVRIYGADPQIKVEWNSDDFYF